VCAVGGRDGDLSPLLWSGLVFLATVAAFPLRSERWDGAWVWDCALFCVGRLWCVCSSSTVCLLDLFAIGALDWVGVLVGTMLPGALGGRRACVQASSVGKYGIWFSGV